MEVVWEWEWEWDSPKPPPRLCVWGCGEGACEWFVGRVGMG